MQSDRHLLLGLLALQCGFISKDQLVSAFSVWTSNKHRSLEQILTASKSITLQQQSLLAALVEEHLKQHGNDPEKSLAALSSLPPIKADLEQIADSELQATLMHVKLKESPPSDPAATMPIGIAQAKSSRFIILRKHAKGGLGQVSVALDSELNRHVALKEILPKCADDPLAQGRFVLEAEITGQLEHPGIVPVYGLGTYGDGRPYYAMRFVEGENLKRAVETFHKDRQSSERLAGPRAVAFRNLLGRFVDVCNAIEYAHSRKVLHRDLKPENILLGPYGETLVVDWGLAKAMGSPDLRKEASSAVRPVHFRSGTSSETIDGTAVGTPAYMSPEQAEGRINELGPATDIYSLGATLYALLTGKPPVKSDTVIDVLEKVRRNDIERPRAKWNSIPRALEAVCMKAMALRPIDRYGSAKALGDEIEKWLADEPVKAYSEPLHTLAKRWIKRHPALVSTTAACVLLGLGIATFLAYLQGVHAREIASKNLALESKNQTIGQQVVDLTHKNQTISEQVQKLESQNYVIAGQKVELQKQNATVTQQKQEVELKNKTIEEQSRNLQAQNHSLQEQNDTIKRQKAELEATNTALVMQKQLADESAANATTSRNEAIKLSEKLSEQLAVSKETTAMLQSIFGFICPQTQGNVIGTLKSEVTLYERRLSADFVDRDSMRFELLNSLGIISFGLQEYGQASRLFSAAHEITLKRKSQLDSNELEIALNWFKSARELPQFNQAGSVSQLDGISTSQKNAFAVAIPGLVSMRTTIKRMEDVWGSMDQRTIDARYLLAEFLENSALVDEAKVELKRILQLQIENRAKFKTTIDATRVRMIELLERRGQISPALAVLSEMLEDIEREHGSGSNQLIAAANEMLNFAEKNNATSDEIEKIFHRLSIAWGNAAANAGSAESWAVAKRNEVWALQRLGEIDQAKLIASQMETAASKTVSDQIKLSMTEHAANAYQLIGASVKASELKALASTIRSRTVAESNVATGEPATGSRGNAGTSTADWRQEMRDTGYTPAEIAELQREQLADSGVERKSELLEQKYEKGRISEGQYLRQKAQITATPLSSLPAISKIAELTGSHPKEAKSTSSSGGLPNLSLRKTNSSPDNSKTRSTEATSRSAIPR